MEISLNPTMNPLTTSKMPYNIQNERFIPKIPNLGLHIRLSFNTKLNETNHNYFAFKYNN